jgi:hypothetical protein
MYSEKALEHDIHIRSFLWSISVEAPSEKIYKYNEVNFWEVFGGKKCPLY